MSAAIQLERKLGVCLATALLAPCALAQTTTTANDADRAVATPAAVGSAQSTYVPMNERERFHYYLTHMFSPEAFLRSAAGAAINQELNVPHEWGQGALGYGRRYASSFGGHITQATIMYGASAALHEDNRYFRSGLTGFGPRFKYAVESTFLARHDDGTRHVSISRIGSFAAAAAISRSWQPPSERGPVHAVDSFAIFVAAETGFNIAREFLPGIFHSRPPVTVAESTVP
jgi:hypothetical protein